MNNELPVEPDLFRRVMRRFPTGVMVMTVQHGSETHAMTANAVTSVSLAPPLVLICIEKNSRSHILLSAAKAFALNILSESQQWLGDQFAYDRVARANPTALTPCTTVVTGAPVFTEALGYLDCRVVATYEGGDHTIFLAEVVAASVTPDSAGPLLYYDRQFHELGDKLGGEA